MMHAHTYTLINHEINEPKLMQVEEALNQSRRRTGAHRTVAPPSKQRPCMLCSSWSSLLRGLHQLSPFEFFFGTLRHSAATEIVMGVLHLLANEFISS